MLKMTLFTGVTV